MNAKVGKFFLFFLTGILCTPCFAEVFEYSKNIYKISESACNEHALDLARSVATKTGGTTKSFYCKPLVGQGFEIRTITEVPEIPPLELAVYGYYFVEYPASKDPINKKYSIISDEGTYGDLDECLRVLPAFEQQFEEQTGLNSTSSQCAQVSTNRYTPQVDSFGTGNRHLYELNISLGRSSGSQALYFDVINYLLSMGALPTNQGKPGSYLHVKYFASNPIKLASSDLGQKNSFVNLEECRTSANLVRDILKSLDKTPLVSLQCVVAENPHFTLPVTIVALFDMKSTDSDRALVSVRTYDRFPNFDDCNAKAQITPKSYCAADIDIYGKLNGYTFNVFE